jgi:hypothetical protein
VSFELDPKLNEFIGIVECKLVSDHPMIRLAQLGLDSKILARVKAPEVVQKAIEKIEKAYESNLIIDGIPIGDFSETLVAQSFFHSEFSKRVPDSDRDQYKMTIAIADLFLSDKGIDGIVYPAITTQFQNESNVVGHNAAIKKEIVDKYYRASRVWLLRCDHLTEKGYALELIKCSDEISNDGLIIWSEKIIEMPT